MDTHGIGFHDKSTAPQQGQRISNSPVTCGWSLPEEVVVMWSHMATRMGIRELRDTLTSTIRRVRAGETIEVTHDGEPVALLTPYPRTRLEQLIASGEVTRGRPLTRPLRRFPVTGPMTASEAIEDDRSLDR